MALTETQLATLSQVNLNAEATLDPLATRLRRIRELLESFKRLRLLGDQAKGDAVATGRIQNGIKQGYGQLNLLIDGDPNAPEGSVNRPSLADLVGNLNGVITNLRTPDTEAFNALAAVLALPDPQ